MKRRALICAALALVVPLPALALTGETASGGLPRAGQLGVSASLDSCGVLEASVVCKIDATFNAVDGATSYTASVTRADGSVVDYGEISGGGATSFWVPYAGDGTYTVTISAYGSLDADSGPDLLARDRSSAPDDRTVSASASLTGRGDSRDGGGRSANDGSGGGSDNGQGADTGPDELTCDPTTVEQAGAPTTTDAETLDASAETPESIACPPTDGTTEPPVAEPPTEEPPTVAPLPPATR